MLLINLGHSLFLVRINWSPVSFSIFFNQWKFGEKLLNHSLMLHIVTRDYVKIVIYELNSSEESSEVGILSINPLVCNILKLKFWFMH